MVAYKNLLLNPDGQFSFKFWRNLNSFGTYQQIVTNYKLYEMNNDIPTRTFQFWTYESNPNINVTNSQPPKWCFTGSYSEQPKIQVIDFYDNCAVNQYAKIQIGEAYTSRFDCGCVYKLAVYLLDDKYALINSFSFTDTVTDLTTKARYINYTFNNQGKNPLRYIVFKNSGKVIK